MTKKDNFEKPKSKIAVLEIIQPVDDKRFTDTMAEVAQESENMRMRYMKKYQNRGFLMITLGGFLALAGAGGFGWFFLVKFDLVSGILCMIPALLVPLMMNWWKEAPLKKYLKNYKSEFMPQMAKALGGFQFYPHRGISRETIGKTGVVPAHDKYIAEDCFVGLHKNVKVMLSEARLLSRKSREPAFHGLFVLLETPHKIFSGHTIITSDQAMAKRSASTRWAKLSPVPVKVENPDWDRFVVYSDKPEETALFVGAKLLKELSEASDIFGKAPITAVLFRGKYIFLMIPHEGDMFEPSTMFVPVTSHQNMLKCKREIERVLEIIDVFEIYRSGEERN